MDKLILVLVEAALELVPRECWRHPAVAKYARQRGKKPGEVLLDRSYHHAAMKSLPQAHKRGRPDIAHFSLLEALGSPLNKRGLLNVYISTLDGYLIDVKPWVRLPRVYERFKGLIEQLYQLGEIRSEDGDVLLAIRRASIQQLVSELSPTRIYLLSEDGEYRNVRELGLEITSTQKPMVLIGGFPHGEFSRDTERLADVRIRIHDTPLEAWITVSRTLCSVETAMIGKEI